ncbi:hypothetical protein LCAA2362_0436 [Lacticaseibacillus casei A2-362]|nr:hypothetical protein LCAA2362_0436 [Lacticaseibacillus casei A2-362]
MNLNLWTAKYTNKIQNFPEGPKTVQKIKNLFGIDCLVLENKK